MKRKYKKKMPDGQLTSRVFTGQSCYFEFLPQELAKDDERRPPGLFSKKPVYEILGIDLADFPPSSQLSAAEVSDHFDKLIEIMREHQFSYELQEDLPQELAYNYLVTDFLYRSEHVLPKTIVSHVTGCDGWCPTCFQIEYCRIKDEIWTTEDLQRLRRAL